MEIPKYKLDFEMDTYYDITSDIEILFSDGSKVQLFPSRRTNKGAIIFEKDTLDQGIAESEGKSRVNRFVNFFIVLSNTDSFALRFPNKPELLNAESFKDKIKTGYAHFGVTVDIVASNPLDKDKITAAGTLMQRVSRLSNEEQDAVSRPVFWLRRAAEVSGEERFVYRWISLEALCAVPQNTYSSTQKMLNILLNSYLTTGTAQDIYTRNKGTIEELARANLTGIRGPNRSVDLKEILENGANPKAIVSKVALCVFEVRNSLFHKGEVLSLVSGCNFLLRDIVSKTLIDVIGKLSA